MNTFWRLFSEREKAYHRYLSRCAQLRRLSGVVLVAQGKQILTTRYFARSKGEVELSFVPDANGEINTIEMIWAGQPVQATRLREPASRKQKA